ncbi:MAG TPA: glycosyl hydrolase [Candidatus Limnocylindrales bacterium]|nr:glycosyl hydrolase [Candidatus Limnocylindrales bacterium]
MNLKQFCLVFFLAFFCAIPPALFADNATSSAAPSSVKPVTPNASPEAVQLLQYLYSVSGNHTLTGQHAVPLLRSARLIEAQRAGGNFPAVFGMDFGFDSPGTWDGINFRQQMVDEAIQKYREGYLIVFMWHAVRPIEDEPVKFKDSIQGKLTEEQWHDLITPGTEINERWKSQVDVIAWYLKQLRDAHVPVLWRPYHEMNGGWFWWGQKRGPDGYQKLYRMLFDRLVNFHKLNNLIWIYGCNEVTPGVDSYDTCYPGDDAVDVLGTDVYRSGFAREQYDQLLALAKDKPIALAEVGVAPSPEILKEQPRWTWFMVWDDPTEGGATARTIRAACHCDQAITLNKLPWVEAGHPADHSFTQP